MRGRAADRFEVALGVSNGKTHGILQALATRLFMAGPSGHLPGHGSEGVKTKKFKKAAWCLNMAEADALENSRQMAEDVIMVFSPTRGLGSVLVGDDLTVLYFASSISPEYALSHFREGKRTSEEKFGSPDTPVGA